MKKKKSIDSLEDAFSNALAGQFDHSAESSTDIGEAREHKSELDSKEALRNIVFEISDDAMQVVMRASESGPLSESELLAALRDLRVVFGIDREAVHRAAYRLREKGGWTGDLIVARGEQPGSPYEISFPFLEQVGESGNRCIWMVDGVILFSGLDSLLHSQNRSELHSIENVVVKAVRTKTVLARIVGVSEGRPGKNVYGETVRQEGFPLQIGANISYDKQSKSFVSDIYGYLLAEGDKLAVLEPLWITPDKMEGFFVTLPQVGERVVPDTDELVFLLLKHGLSEKCLHFEVINKLAQKLAAGERLPVTVRVASGIQPHNGLDADIVYSQDYRKRAGTLRRDDSIDLRERNAVVTVRKGDLVARKRMPTKGLPGMNLFGQTLPAVDGRDKAFQVGQGVAAEKIEDRILYYAKSDGNVVLHNGTLSIVEVYKINGDVDYGTGNIAVNTDLYINGSVRAGFSVKCEGNLHIQGEVETGAFVFAKNNVSIGRGIIGENTKVVCFGNLHTQFVQDAEVMAKGDITIGSYIYNGMVRSGGTISVKKEAEIGGGKVIGGVVCASKGIECSAVGSPTNRNTVLALQASPERLGTLKSLEKEIQEHREAIMKMMRTLQLDSVDPLAIRAKIEGLGGKNKVLFTRQLLNLNTFLKEKNRLELEKKALQDKIDDALGKAKIRVRGMIFQGSEIQIGQIKLIVPSDVGPAVFQLQDNRIIL